MTDSVHIWGSYSASILTLLLSSTILALLLAVRGLRGGRSAGPASQLRHRRNRDDGAWALGGWLAMVLGLAGVVMMSMLMNGSEAIAMTEGGFVDLIKAINDESKRGVVSLLIAAAPAGILFGVALLSARGRTRTDQEVE